jgi:hypothetical protein
MSEARTDRASYLFKATEYANGTPWITLVPHEGNIPLFENAVLGFDLRPSTSLQEAEKIADYLNQNLFLVNCTTEYPKSTRTPNFGNVPPNQRWME